MASRDYTILHNLVFRGCGIHTKYVGVFGYIVGQTDGWMLTEKKIAKDLEVGRDFVRAALTNFEQAGCLIRVRLRNSRGHLEGAVWFVTDLPAQLKHLGFDRATIDARVRAAFEEWRSSMSGLESETSTLDLTWENSATPPSAARQDAPPPAETGQNRRSEPKSAEPTLADPTLADPTPKKNKREEDQHKQADSPRRTPPARPSKPACPPAEPEGPGAKLLRSLDVGSPITDQLVRQCHERVEMLLETWPADVLAKHFEKEASGGSVLYPMALLTTVVRGTNPRVAPQSEPKSSGLPDPCGECEWRPGDPVSGRVVWVDEGRSVSAPCPRCHPRAVAGRQQFAEV